MRELQHLIDGEPRPAGGGGWLDVFEPATGAVVARCPDGGDADVDAAVRAARAAFPAWSALRPSERARWLERLAEALEGWIDAVAEAESENGGKPLALARELEIPRAVANLRFFAAAATQFASESHHGEAGFNVTLRRPLGVAACISPWNLPLYLFTWKIAPALAAGNCVVAKPSEVTPVSAYLLGELARQIGFPKGVLNIVHGRGPQVGHALVEHPGIDAITFTGSTRVGTAIAASAGARLVRASLELGGKNAGIVFADAPTETLLDTLLRASFQNAGQICLCTSRLLIERRAYDGFREAFVERARALAVGDPREPATRIGPMVSRAHFNKVLGHIRLAREEGGHILCGGEAVRPKGRCRDGWFIAPTVIEGLGPGSRTNTEEIFGPVVTLQPFDDEDEALALANASPYGLAASLWTSRLGRAHRMAGHLEAGIVWVNTWLARDLRTPFGGMKQSGLGREGGMESMRFFTETRNLCIDTSQA